MLDQAIRFGAILAQPEFAGAGAILEVGSGSQGISAFLFDKVVGVDVAFAEAPAKGLIAVRASALHLPLRDRSFERVICSDMMEHLPVEQRAAAIQELLKVTKGYLFIACPCDEAARRSDERLMKLYRWLGIRPPEWLEDHLQKRIPDSQEIEGPLGERKARWKTVIGESTASHIIVSLLISSKLLNRFWESIFKQHPSRARALGTLRILKSKSHYRKLWIIHCGFPEQSLRSGLSRE